MSMEFQLGEIRSHNIEREHDETFIYSLMIDDVCIYVGQTKNLKQRLYSHLANEKEFKSAIVYLCYDEDANNEEAKTIVKRGAKLNGMLPKTDSFVSMHSIASEMTRKITDELGVLNPAFSSEIGKKLRYFDAEEAESLIETVCSIIQTMVPSTYKDKD